MNPAPCARDSAPLAAALAVAVALDVPSLAVGIWVDEWTTLDFAGGSFAYLVDRASADPSPPLFYALMWLVLRIVPPGLFVVRGLSFAAHLALVALTWRYALRFHGRRAATLAAFGIAANPTMIWHATNGRTYALMALAVLFAIEACRRERWAAFGAWSAAAVWLHYGAALAPAIAVAWDAARRRRLSSPAAGEPPAPPAPSECAPEALLSSSPALRAALAAALVCSPLGFHFVHATLANHPPFSRFDLGTAIEQQMRWTGLDGLPPVVTLVALPALLAFAAVRARRAPLEAALWLGTCGMLGAFALWHGSAYHPKFILWSLPFAQVCIARAFAGPDADPADPEPRGPGAAALAALGGLWIAVVVFSGWQSSGLEKSIDRHAARVLAAQLTPADRVVFEGATSHAFKWELERMPRTGRGAPATWIVHDEVLPDRTLRCERREGARGPLHGVAKDRVVLESRDPVGLPDAGRAR